MKSEITQEMAFACYETAKEIYPNRDLINDSARKIESKTDMNYESARDYLRNFFFMRNGEKMEHDMSGRDTRFYFECIQRDYGNDALKKALYSLQLYLALEQVNHPGLQKILNDFYKILEEEKS